MNCRTSVGATPRCVTSISDARRNSLKGSPGIDGAPSASTSVAPDSSTDKRVSGPITQPMSVIQRCRSSRFMSRHSRKSAVALACTPKWVCTTPLGRPVVPEV